MKRRIPISILFFLLSSIPILSAGPLALIGGGRVSFYPGSWSEGVFRWIVTNGGKKNAVILTCTEETDELPNYFLHLGAASARNLKLNNRFVADLPETYSTIEGADILLICDGKPWENVSIWRGTRTESAIRDHFSEGKILAGIGNGAKLLGGIIADERNGELTPDEAVRQPGSPKVTFSDDFLSILPGIIVEPKFVRKGKLPILALNLARRQAAVQTQPLIGIGIDEKTAVLIDEKRNATTIGEGTVTIMTSTASSAIRLDPRLPLVFTNISCDSLTEGFVFDLENRQLIAVPPDADPGGPPPVVPSWKDEMIYGGKKESENLGDFSVVYVDHDSCSLQLGTLQEIQGQNRIPGTVIVPMAYSQPEFLENRMGGLFWSLARHAGYQGILIDSGGVAEVSGSGLLKPLPTSRQPSIMISDASKVFFRTFSRWRSLPGSKGERQSAGLVGNIIHFLATPWSYNLRTGAISRNL